MLRLLAVGALTCLVFAGGALATTSFTPLGEGQVIGSWSQGWAESGVGSFDHMQLYMVDQNFEAPGIANLSNASWSGTLVDPQTVIADGDPVSSLSFSLHYLPAKSTPFHSILTAWSGTTLVDSTQANWSGSNWSFAPVVGGADAIPYQAVSTVPEPITMFGVLLGVGGIGRYLRRRKLA